MDTNKYTVEPLAESDFSDVVSLGNLVHGNGYLSNDALQDMLRKSIKNNLNASFVMRDGEKLIGFRISYAPEQWTIDKWSTPKQWPVIKSKVAYFKCNTIHPEYQGQGLGGILLSTSVDKLKEMGAQAGLSHIWMQSPGNASFKYFTKAGGILIKEHKDRWFNDPTSPDYQCVICGDSCRCVASEMMLVFK
jgi:ribosomal protein S18 acetylase RimI-like enzyme